MPEKKWRTHALIPDTQNKEGTKRNHLFAAGNYLADKEPDVVHVIGDWWDMPSLSLYDSAAQKVKEKRYYMGQGCQGDIGAGNAAMETFLAPMKKNKRWWNRMELHFYEGNHENRIDRALVDSPHLAGAISKDHLALQDFDHVHPFLAPHECDGILYSHYFCLDSNGRVMNSRRGQASARAQVQNCGQSATAGHKQGIDTHVKETPGGRMRGLICGSFYQHAEAYLSPQGNSHWQGIVLKNEVRDGDYDLMEVSLGFLLRKYA